ncbi:DNA (cytosine-5-)-methyltransferase [Mammaliicoccus sciuri]|uniref:DNA (cytosine-5-)-methyltransferase n=1 Tax=Mammaliicoccus sciuri TaxID=1296 RepID=UPI00209CD69E|nr:DNA (cytosine-5-)-methyltransferase [Mammaliicoccus sciuri]MCP1288308.1 DNA (cytosine-5-)-methyltransferase [Mammaliicoccus sciuri]
MKFIDLFSGIGGFRSALEMNGHECLAFAEIDKYARQSYKAIYNTEDEQEWHDVTRITDDDFRHFKNKADIIVGGFPCQAFSIAGKRKGFEDTRGTLFFEIARAIKEIQPSYVLLENVKGLFSHDGGRTFGTIIQTLDELGFITEWGLFNSKYWGVPQNRERVYILATRKDKYKEPLLFDLVKQQTEVTTRLIDVLEDEVDEKYYLSEEKTKKLTLDHDLSGDIEPAINVLGNTSITGYRAHDVHDADGISPTIATRDYKGPKQVAIKQIGNIVDNKGTYGGNPQRGRVYNSEGLSPALNCMRGGGLEPKIAVPVLTPDRINKRQNGRRFKEDGDPMFTLTSQDRHGIAIREATKQGYAIAEQGDSVNVSFPTSTTRRGRVGKQVAQTLQAGEVNQGVVMKDIRIRKLTPLECWRLQGFTDEQFYKAKDSGVSNSQLYKQAGNSVTVNVVDVIVKQLKED